MLRVTSCATCVHAWPILVLVLCVAAKARRIATPSASTAARPHPRQLAPELINVTMPPVVPESLRFEEHTIRLWKYQELEYLPMADLNERATTLLTLIGAARLPALDIGGASHEETLIWILQVEVALAHGQGLRCAFGEPVDAAALGVPPHLIDESA